MKAVVIVYIALVVLAMSACQKPNQQTATVPDMSADCINYPQACNPNVYQQHPGFQNYNYNPNYNPYYNQNYYPNQNYSNLCSCPYGTVPTYNNYAGLGCVQQNQLYGYGYAYFTWGPHNTHWVNTPQISNIGANYAGQHSSYNTCYNGVVQSCLVDQTNTCSVGYTCRVTAASSRLGLCVANNTNPHVGYSYR